MGCRFKAGKASREPASSLTGHEQTLFSPAIFSFRAHGV